MPTPIPRTFPTFPVMDLLSRAWQIQEGDPLNDETESRIRGEVSTRRSGRSDPFVGSALFTQIPGDRKVSPELWKSRLYEAIQLILAISHDGPTLSSAVEDLHWADYSSIELLRLLLKDFQLPAVFLCAYRPPFSLLISHQSTGLGKFYNEIKLQDLSTSEAETMVESLLKTEAIPSDLRRFIQTRVEGNPFYLEEVVNALIESETLIREDGQLETGEGDQ